MERVRNVFGPQSPDIQAFTVYHELRMKETTLFSGKRERGYYSQLFHGLIGVNSWNIPKIEKKRTWE